MTGAQVSITIERRLRTVAEGRIYADPAWRNRWSVNKAVGVLRMVRLEVKREEIK